MGTDKAALSIGGMTLLERTARLALAVNLPVLVIGRAQPDGWPLPEVTFVEDAVPELGPAGGLATALRHAQTSVLAVACDLPLLTEDALRWLMAQARSQFEPSGLVTVNNGQREPLFAVYDLTCLPLIEAQLAKGRRSMKELIEAGEFVLDPAPEWVSVQLANVNTPEEWREKSGLPCGPR
jgi:molybdopterin-guanine dinucleotide biosynthesis protein A